MSRLGVFATWVERGRRMRVVWADWPEGVWQVEQLQMHGFNVETGVRYLAAPRETNPT
jgi:hypothetical protein